MTRKAYLPYFKKLAKCMNLAHWCLEIEDSPPSSPTAVATVCTWHARFGATIRLSDTFLRESREWRRYYAVHELVHLYLAHSDVLVDDLLNPSTKNAWTVAGEYAVDAIASTLAPFMPLPR